MRKMSEKEVWQRVKDLQEVATVPASLVRILQVTQNPESTARELSAEIARDPALSLKVLRTANSSFYGFGRRIQTISDAVILLGFTEVERLALAISIINRFGSARRHEQLLRQLWTHSLAVSIACDAIVEDVDQDACDYRGCHVTGLLHDIGKAVLWQCIPEVCDEVTAVMDERNCEVHEAERFILGGVCHTDVGAYVGERWTLPEAIVEGIRDHHLDSAVMPSAGMAFVVNTADLICTRLGTPSQPRRAPHAEDAEPENPASEKVKQRLEKRHPMIAAVRAMAI